MSPSTTNPSNVRRLIGGMLLAGVRLLTLAGMASCANLPAASSSAPGATWLTDVEIANPSNFARTEDIFFSCSELGVTPASPDWPHLLIQRNGATEHFRMIDRNRDGNLDGILVHLELAAAERSVLRLTFGSRQARPMQLTVEATEAPRSDDKRPPALRTIVRSSRAAAQKKIPHKNEALYWATRLADSELQRRGLVPRAGGEQPAPQRFVYSYDTSGLLPMGFAALAKATADARYTAPLTRISASFVSADGSISGYSRDSFNIDNIAPGVAFLELLDSTGDARFRKAAAVLRSQLVDHPRTSQGAFWHKQRYPSQLWLDGVYMGMPFLARYTRQFEDGRAYAEVVNEFVVAREHLLDAKSGLYFHAWDEARQQEWADPVTGRSRQFWGRGMGWFAMALIDVLDVIPEDRTELRRPLLQMVRELAPSLQAMQDRTHGTWWQVLDRPGRYGNYLESSASAMFTYFLARGVNRGYLDDRYSTTARRAFAGMVNDFILIDSADVVSLGSNCQVAGLGNGRDGSYDYYISEPVVSNDAKAVGPFLLAAVEVAQLKH